MVSEASAFGWTSPTLPKLLSEDSAVQITADESSWIVSLMVMGQIFGPIPSALLVDRSVVHNTLNNYKIEILNNISGLEEK